MNIFDLFICLLALIILRQRQTVCGFDVMQIRPVPRGGLWLVNASRLSDFSGDQMNCGGYLVLDIFIGNVLSYRASDF